MIVLADRMSNSPGRLLVGDRRELRRRAAPARARHNSGGLFAALWVPDAEPAPGADPDGWWAEGMLHEITHNLGAVGDSAPHSSGYGHCCDGYDVMCYHDDPAAPAMTYPCPRIPGVMSQVYDCGGDDYFNVAPAAGSYLATHWNLYDNRFLAACDRRRPACGGTTVPGLQPAAAGLDHPPAITGDAAGRIERSPRSPARGRTRRPPSSTSGSRATARPGWPSRARRGATYARDRGRRRRCACACG